MSETKALKKTVSAPDLAKTIGVVAITTLVAISWICFRVLSLVVLAFIPGVADAAIRLQQGADDVMMVAVGFYCGNSVAEKGIVGYFNARAKAKETDSEEDNNIGENG